MMLRSMPERVDEWRKKEVNKGGRSLSVWLYPKTAKQFHELKVYFKKSRKGRNVNLIASAIQMLHEKTFKQ